MKVVTVIGARPQFIKAAVVSRAFKDCRSDVSEMIVHTGQHYDANMSSIFFDELGIPTPHANLNVGGGSHGQNTGRMLEKIENILLEEKPDKVLVYGDTDSTLAGALAASKLHIPVVHVEAGLRSFNMRMPEEINRILTDQVSSQLFCPTESAVKNLEGEGFFNKGCEIHNVGDVMYDAVLFYAQRSAKPNISGLESSFILMTLHRAENTNDLYRLSAIIRAINKVHLEIAPVVIPLHPRTKSFLERNNIFVRAHVVEPVGYLEMIWLLEHCSLVMSDSGGLQKEAYFFGKKCLTLRDQTEWVELVSAGVNQLVSADEQSIYEGAKDFYGKSFDQLPLYGEGDAGKHIVKLI